MSSPFSEQNISPIEKSLSKSLEELVGLFKKSKNYTLDELKAIALLSTDRYFQNALKLYVLGKKHIKGKFTEQIIKMFAKTAEIVASAKQEQGFFGGLGQRLRG
ncbi:MAG TPA: hypothetical protein VGB37_17465 [Candidatus Lokiarchaeia archaeon]